ncbi:MAG TPA: acyl-CoA dehydrogenase family protein [Dehalococcoidia bacterium]|nr:acyl-CoA dehydrogenase family protein [Dehalococcoidia bacterium]
MDPTNGQLQPGTEPGLRFLSIVEGHTEAFRTRAREHDAASTFVAENLGDLKHSGGIAAFVPEELGGLGLASIYDWISNLDRLGRADPSTAIALNMHLTVTRNLAAAWRTARERRDEAARARNEAMLQAVAAGELVVCATATEAGTDFLRPSTTAARDGDGWLINGRKFFVTMSPVANLCVVGLRVDESDGAKIGFAFVPTDTPGFEPQNDWDALGMRGSGSQSVVFNDCRVPLGAVHVAGDWGGWNPGTLMGRTVSNLTLVAVFLGIAERARELAVESALAQTKSKLGGALSTSSGVQHLLGEIEIELAASRAILGDAASRLDTFLADPDRPRPSLETMHGLMRDYQCAKWVVNQGAIRIVSRAMDICGGGAFMGGHELSRLYRDVRAGPFMQPFSPTEMHEYIGQVGLGILPAG